MGAIFFIFLSWKYAWLHIGCGTILYWAIHFILTRIGLGFANLSYGKDPIMTPERYHLTIAMPLIMIVPAVWLASKAMPMIIPLLP